MHLQPSAHRHPEHPQSKQNVGYFSSSFSWGNAWIYWMHLLLSSSRFQFSSACHPLSSQNPISFLSSHHGQRTPQSLSKQQQQNHNRVHLWTKIVVRLFVYFQEAKHTMHQNSSSSLLHYKGPKSNKSVACHNLKQNFSRIFTVPIKIQNAQPCQSINIITTQTVRTWKSKLDGHWEIRYTTKSK